MSLSTYPGSQTLCQRCSKLFDEDLEAEIQDGAPASILGPPSTWSTNDCDICRCLFACLPPESHDTTSDIYVQYEPLDWFQFRGVTRKISRIPKDEEIKMMSLQYNIKPLSWIPWYLLPTKWLHPYEAIPPLIDFNIVRSWLQNPVLGNTPGLLQDGVQLTVIDCETNSLVLAPDGADYVTLSYVWGPRSTNVEEGLNDSKLPDQIPQTIRDAMSVCSSLGFRYLWIDRYCIPQSNLRQRMSQIQQMNLIYSGSALTLVACASGDPQRGLPGISRPRLTCPSFNLGRHGEFRLMPTSLDVTTSIWSERGWTYQEARLARRLLYFTYWQLYFERPGLVDSELTFPLANPSIPRDLHEEYMYSADAFPSRPFNVYECIRSYSPRQLTFPNDIIRAFLGVFSVFEKEYNMRHLWGLPFVAHRPAFVNDVWYFFPSLSSSLLWQTADADDMSDWLARRPGFPSWSWTGWFGIVAQPNVGILEDMREQANIHKVEISSVHHPTAEPDMHVEIELVSGARISWNEYQQNYELYKYGISDLLRPFIHVTAYTTPIRFKQVFDGEVDSNIPDPFEPCRFDLSFERKDGGWWHKSSRHIKHTASIQNLSDDDNLLALHIRPSWYTLFDLENPYEPIYDLLRKSGDQRKLEHLLIILRQREDHWERFFAVRADDQQPLKDLKMVRQTIRWG